MHFWHLVREFPNHKKVAADNFNTFRTNENAKWKTYELQAATDRQTYELGLRDKIQAFMTGFAAEERMFRVGVNGLQTAAEVDIHGDEATHTANLTGHARTFVVNVSNQLAFDYSMWHAGDAGQTAVGNAYADRATACNRTNRHDEHPQP